MGWNNLTGFIHDGFHEIPGYEGRYAVNPWTNHVWSIPRRVRTGFGWQQIGGHFLKAKDNGTALQVNLSNGSKSRVHNIGAIKLMTFVGPRPNGMETCHNDGDYTNNHLDNVRWDTKLNNEADKIAHDTHQLGEQNHQHKLTETDVHEIRRLLRWGGYTQRSIAQMLDIGEVEVCRIKYGTRWGWLEDAA